MTRSAFLFTLCFLLLFAGSLTAQTTLEDIAKTKKVYIGNIISNQHLDNPTRFRNGVADQRLTEEFDVVTLENYMKMGFVLPRVQPADIHNLTASQLRATLQTNQIERFLSRPEWDGLRKRGHAMIWYNQAPNWLNSAAPNWTAQQVFEFSRKYIFALGEVCGDRIAEWDVINEAISDQTSGGRRLWRQGTWYRKANDGTMTTYGPATYENYIRMLFVWAREAQPGARLYYNDYSIERFSSAADSKNGFMRQTFKELKECGAPIDAIGFQGHFTLAEMTRSSGTVNTNMLNSIRASIRDLATANIEVAITELDIRICNNDRPEAFQEAAFREFAAMALGEPNCHELLIWGMRDEDNWITLSNTPPFNGCQDAVIFQGTNYNRKAAYNGLAAGLQRLADQEDYSFQNLDPGAGAGNGTDCGGNADTDVLQAIRVPGVVEQGEMLTLEVDYTASVGRDIVIFFQLDEAPFTVLADARLPVAAGRGTAMVPLTIPADAPVSTDRFQFQVLIAPTGGSWDERLNNIMRTDVDVVAGTSAAVDPAWSALGAQVFPNPTHGRLTIGQLPTDQPATYAVYDAVGRRITGAVAQPAAGAFQLDLTTFPAGFYTLTVEQSGLRSVQRVLRK